MSKRDQRRVVLNDFKAKKAEEGTIAIELDSGGTVNVPPPELWPDEAMSHLTAEDHVEAAKLILGADYATFTEAGGTALTLLAIIKDEHGIEAGE